MTKIGGRERGVDGGRIGKTFLLEETNGSKRRGSLDRGERGMGEVRGEIGRTGHDECVGERKRVDVGVLTERRRWAGWVFEKESK